MDGSKPENEQAQVTSYAPQLHRKPIGVSAVPAVSPQNTTAAGQLSRTQ